MTSKKSSKKIQDIFLDDTYKILSFMRHGVVTPVNLRYELGIESKQNLNHYLKKYVQEGILQKLDKGMYVMTESGKRIYDQYEHYKNKQLVRVENLKVTFVVEKGGEELVKNLKFKKQELRNNVTMYHAQLKRHSIRLIVSKNKYKFEVTVTNSLGITPSEAFHHAMLEAYDVANYLTNLFDVELSEGYANGKPEIAIPSPIASALLNTTGSSQIRTNKAIMNRSKGRGADWEVYNLQDAQKIVDMPDVITRLEEKMDRMELLLSRSSNPFYSDLAGNSQLGFF
jgi:predicted transcriptional regulator